jgi:ribosomal protein L35
MPKQKTHKGTKKTLPPDCQRQGQASPARAPAIWRRAKSHKRKRNLRGTKVVDKTVLHQITRALAGNSN